MIINGLDSLNRFFMSSFLPILYKVYDLVYDSVYGYDQKFYYIAKHLNISNQKIMSKPNYSIPKIYTGGIVISTWKQLSVEEQSKALKKEWYIYYSFRCPQSGLLKRVTPIKGYANSYKSMKERMQYLNTLRDSLELLLKNGANPFENNDFSYLDDYFNETPKPKTSNSEVKVADEVKPIEEKKKAVVDKQKIDSIKNSFENVLNIKKNQMNLTSYKNYKLRIMRFMNYLPDASLPIDSIVKKDVINFLNEILETTSPRSRNNYRTDLNSFFNELENNEYIENNFISKINVLKSNPERNKTFSDKIQKEIYEYLGEEDKMLLLFIQFISYNFLRPVEVCRLKIKDIDLNERKISVRAKNKPVKVKIIPEILINELPNLKTFDPESYLFTPDGFGMNWDIEENNKRDFFSKRFNKVVKKKFELDKDFGLYSFRHTFITRLYRKLRENLSPQIAKSELMLITGHNTLTALDKYLRDIDAELPDDYSNLFK